MSADPKISHIAVILPLLLYIEIYIFFAIYWTKQLYILTIHKYSKTLHIQINIAYIFIRVHVKTTIHFDIKKKHPRIWHTGSHSRKKNIFA